MYLINSMCLKPGDIVNKRYEIINELGRGGFGVTYKAYDRNESPHSNIVALKQISTSQRASQEVDTGNNYPNQFPRERRRDNDYLKQLQREDEILSSLEHPCIPKFYDSFEDGDFFYIVQEYIEGHNLSQEILPGEPIDEEEAISILREVLEVLKYVHQQNIIHRDIKPANLIRRYSDNKIVVIDFGAFTEIATQHTSSHNHNNGATVTKVIFAPGYSSIEQLSGIRCLNSDIYSLGILIMQAVTGFSITYICDPNRPPLRNSNNQLRYEWEDDAPRISLKLKQIISRMIEHYSRDRYQSVDEILQDLDRETPITPPPPPEPNRGQKIVKFIIISISAALLSIVLFKIFEKYYILPRILFSQLNDNISSGEEILDPLSKGSIKSSAAKEYKAAQKYIALPKYKQEKYQDALADYQLSWQKERRDAESLIYLNNALLEASKADYYTIAVAVPLSFNEEADIHNSDIAQNFLRGIAQAQTEINLSLPDAKHSILKQLSGLELLKSKQISDNSAKGLKVIIIDDGNNLEQAQQAAKKIAKVPNLLGILGHYASEMSLGTVDIYKQNNLAQISFSSTTKKLSTKYRNNFFRTAYTNNEEAETIVEYIQSINSDKISDKIKVAGFYSPDSDYSNYLWIEIKDRLKQENIPVIKEFDIADESFNTSVTLKELDNKDANLYILIPDGQVTNASSNAIKIIKEDDGKNIILGDSSIVIPEVEQLQTTRPFQIVASLFWHPLSSPNLDFVEQSKQLWQGDIDNGTAIMYDASLALIKAIKLQTKPSRKGTIKELSNPKFQVKNGATGSIKFNSSNNSPKNGDRINFYPTLIRLHECSKGNNYFIPLSLNVAQASALVCQNE